MRKEGLKPVMSLVGESEVKLHLSISHDGDYVLAFVVAER